MTTGGAVQVRRATRGDVAAIVEVVGNPAVDGAAVMGWLLERGLLVAEQLGRVLGVIGWQVENLVAVVDLLHLAEEELWPAVGTRLVQAVEAAADDLMCEIAVLAVPKPLPAQALPEVAELGYTQQEWESLHRYWREVLASFGVEAGLIWAHRLRKGMVMRPI
jgi:hypothetical protein